MIVKNVRTFLLILSKSLNNRRLALAVASLSMVLGASLVAALLLLSLDMGSKAGRELRAYGANMLLTPRATSLQVGTGALSFGLVTEEGVYLDEKDMGVFQEEGISSNILSYVPYLYGSVEIDEQRVTLVGTRFDALRKTSSWWKLTGEWIDVGDVHSAIVGVNVAERLRLRQGDDLNITYQSRIQRFTVKGVVDTGGSEDDQIFVLLEEVQRVLERPGSISEVQISALTDKQPLSTLKENLERRLPHLKVSLVSQLAQAETMVIGKVQLLMTIISVVVLLASAMVVMTTMTTSVLERAREIGLMKALGASDMNVSALFLAEGGAIGVVGGVLGYGLGFILAQFVGRTVFGTGILLRPLLMPITLGVALAVALLACAVPVGRAVRIDPAITLRGE